MRLRALQCRWAIGNPDTLPIEIHLTGCRATGSFLRSSAGEERTVEQTQLPMPRRIRDRDGKKARVLVVDGAQIDAVPMSVGCEPETLPVEEVLRHCQGYPWTQRRKCGVGHDVVLQWFHIGNAGILTATAAIT